MERELRQRLERDIEEAVQNVLDATHNRTAPEVENVTIHDDLANAETRYTGVYASVYFHSIGVTQEQLEMLADDGLHHVETATHVTPNPDMDDDITEISLDELDDAAETDVELILELGAQYIPE